MIQLDDVARVKSGITHRQILLRLARDIEAFIAHPGADQKPAADLLARAHNIAWRLGFVGAGDDTKMGGKGI